MASLSINSIKIEAIPPHIAEILANQDLSNQLTERIRNISKETLASKQPGHKKELSEGLKNIYIAIKSNYKPKHKENFLELKLTQAVSSCLRLLTPPEHDEVVNNPAFHGRAIQKAFTTSDTSSKPSREVVRKYTFKILEAAYKQFNNRPVFLLRSSSSYTPKKGNSAVVLSVYLKSTRSGRMKTEQYLLEFCTNSCCKNDSATGKWSLSGDHDRGKKFSHLNEAIRNLVPMSSCGVFPPQEKKMETYQQSIANYEWEELKQVELFEDETAYTLTKHTAKDAAEGFINALHSQDVYRLHHFFAQPFLLEQFLVYCPKENLLKLENELKKYPFMQKEFSILVFQKILQEHPYNKQNQELLNSSLVNVHDLMFINSHLLGINAHRVDLDFTPLLESWGIKTKQDYIDAGLLHHLPSESIIEMDLDTVKSEAEHYLTIKEIHKVGDLLVKGVFNRSMLKAFLT